MGSHGFRLYGSIKFTGVSTATTVPMVGVPDVLNVKEIVENTIQGNKRRMEVEQRQGGCRKSTTSEDWIGRGTKN